jgi:hypothetical protein
VRLRQAIRATPHLHLANRQGFHFSPLATNQRHHRPVGAPVLDRRPTWRRWSLALQALHFVGLLSHVRGSSRLSVAPHRRFIQLHPPEEDQFCGRLRERQLGPQSSHTFG